MSKFINEIIEDIRNHPETWVRYGKDGLQKNDIIIDGCGNGHKLFFAWMTSIVEISVNKKEVWGHITWRDKYRMEETFRWWIRNASLQMMSA